jgi:uncharacterized protein YegP (UPF0339 family)
MYTFNIYRGTDGYRFRLLAPNGEIIATGEAYANRGDVLHTVGKIVDLTERDIRIEFGDARPFVSAEPTRSKP